MQYGCKLQILIRNPYFLSCTFIVYRVFKFAVRVFINKLKMFLVKQIQGLMLTM